MMRLAPVIAVTALLILPHVVDAQTGSDPVPIPGNTHVFAPGPRRLRFQGLDVEPSTITNFHGFSALAYVGGTATDADGNTYTMQTDMRVFSGTYVSADGSVLQGTFAFI